MSRPDHPLRQTLAALAREELRGAPHPATAQLIAYQRGELSAEAAALIREHLSLCDDCAAAVLDAADFFADEEDEEADDPAASEAAWQQLNAARSRVEEDGTRAARLPPPAAFSVVPPRGAWRELPRSPIFAYGVAAVFAAVCIGLVVFKAPAAPAPRPEVNAGIYDLSPLEGVRGESTPVGIRFAAPGGVALLVLNPAAEGGAADFGARILRGDGSQVWQAEGLRRQASGAFHVSLADGALPPGSYTIVLFGVTAEGEKPFGSYRIVIEKSSSGS